MTAAEAVRPRIGALLALSILVPAGLAVRYGMNPDLANFLGVAMWSVTLYTVIVLARPSIRVATAGILCLAISFAVELGQLTPYPAELVGIFRPAHLVFGSGFEVRDLPAYAAGAAAATAMHAWLRGRARSRTSRPRRF